MCKEQVGIGKEAVTARVMRICWPSAVGNKEAKSKTPAEACSDADEIRRHDTCRKTLCKISDVFMTRK
jgi:hypothetical protein